MFAFDHHNLRALKRHRRAPDLHTGKLVFEERESKTEAKSFIPGTLVGKSPQIKEAEERQIQGVKDAENSRAAAVFSIINLMALGRANLSGHRSKKFSRRF